MDASYFYCLAILSFFTIFLSMPSSSSRVSKSQPVSFCRDDFLVAVNEDLPISNSTRALSSRRSLVNFTKERVGRHELLRFQSHDGQWVIRTWDGSHLAMENDGRLTVKTGCVTTTFLRLVSFDDLLSCFEGISCKMILCATSLSTGASFIVKRDDQAVRVSSGECKSYQKFKESETLKRLQKSGQDRYFEITFLIANSESVKTMLVPGLKRLCPRTFDPTATVSYERCAASVK
ncbi:uncharacterized protein LOC134193392 [Corticium candelabrum]|uniref:uncharacterized protein LOC134193392 n=1 Tax=Corticium candelabrum TaxID=121492 RepID=UPI002E26C37D|nr:uncharacterized protein LOC134193392 [Corticium candelabrum]